MILSGNAIRGLVEQNRQQRAAGVFDPSKPLCRPSIDIDPFEPSRLNPHSYNLRLGPKLLLYESGHRLHKLRQQGWSDLAPGTLDMRVENPTVEVEIGPEGIVLYPGVLYLGNTVERVAAWGLAPKIDGRSSVGRLGLLIHLTAGYGDSGFNGQYTLELAVIQPLRVYAGVEICQVSFEDVLGEVTDYVGKYNSQAGPVPSRIWKEFRSHTGT